jgi:hypothetical protein
MRGEDMEIEEIIKEAELPLKEMKLAGYDIMCTEELKKEANWVHPATVAWARKESRNLFLYYFGPADLIAEVRPTPGWYVGDPPMPMDLDDAVVHMRDWFEEDA